MGEDGTVYGEYSYDAWGNCTIVTDESGIATPNPFRYRGYYFDEETGLYYLQTRYYDPEVGRFISRDSIEYADPETICGLNLYAYCGNNPVMFADLLGTSWSSFWNGVKNFFTKDIPNFFTKTIPDFFTKTIPDFFKNTVWNDWIVDKLWNQFIVGTIWEKGLVPAWEWLNGDSWYQMLIKNIVISTASTALGAVIGSAFGPVGTVAGAVIGILSGLIVGTVWDCFNLGFNA